VLRKSATELVEHFRRTVAVVDRLGDTDPQALLAAAHRCAAESADPAPAFAPAQVVTPRRGYLPERMVSDPAGYFVLYVDRRQQLLSLEHYRTGGVLDAVLEGRTAPELYTPAIAQGLVSRLDHAAYLGRELARAEHALRSGTR
jgi:tetrahydromethanopterin S-methyltransferase subunit A